MYFLGVDLGTTYTAAAIVRDDRAEMVQLGTRAASISSGVFLRDDGEVLVGEPAMRRGLVEPGRLATQTKRRFGDPVPLILGGTAYPVEMLTARLLRHVVDTVAEREGEQAANVAITHPANWGPYKLDLLSQVCAMADLERFVLVAEPVGAAVHYAAQARVPDGATVLVYDLGGGTFDAAVLTKQGDGFEVVGRPEGVDRLGGVDVDAVVLRHVLDSLGPDADGIDGSGGIDGSDDAATAAMARLRVECVDAKEALSSDTDTDIAFSWKGIDTRVRLTRVELEARCRVLLDESIAATRRALRGADVDPADLDAVLLVGGGSRMPLVAELVAATLGRPVAVDVDPKHSVALGAARMAALAVLPVATGSAGLDAVGAQPTVAAASPLASPASGPVSPAGAPVTSAVASAAPPSAAPPSAGPPSAGPPSAGPPSAGPPSAGPPSAGPPSAAPPSAGPPSAASASLAGVAGGRRRVRPPVIAAAVVAVVGAVAIVALAMVVLGGDDDDLDAGVEGGADAPAADAGAGWISPCPTGAAAVCIEAVEFVGDELAISFRPQGVALSAPPLQGDELAPVFFLTAGTPEQPDASLASGADPRRWGPSSPMQGEGVAGDSGWSNSTLPGGASAVCVGLFDATGSVRAGSGNCAALPE